jgi:hypothetical protein
MASNNVSRLEYSGNYNVSKEERTERARCRDVCMQENVEGHVKESHPHASTVFHSIRNAGVADVPLDALLLTRSLMIGFMSLGA